MKYRSLWPTGKSAVATTAQGRPEVTPIAMHTRCQNAVRSGCTPVRPATTPAPKRARPSRFVPANHASSAP